MSQRAGQGSPRRRERDGSSIQSEAGQRDPRAMITICTRQAVIFLGVIVMSVAIALAADAGQAGQLGGSIYDQTGGALVGALVTARGAVSREGRTDAAGRF